MVDRKLTPQRPSFTLVPSACGWRAVVVAARGEPAVREGASFGEAAAAGFALEAELARGGHPLPVTVALPARCAIFERLTLPTADPAELTGMVRLQLEKNLPYPIEETAFGFQVLPRRSANPDEQTTLLAYAVHEAAASTLCAPLLERRFPGGVTLWALHAAAQAREGETACGLWREENALVFGVFENRRLSFVETFAEEADPLAALPRALIRAEMAGAPVNFQEVLLDKTISALKEPVSQFLEAPAAELPEVFSPLPPGETADLFPPSWRAQAARKERFSRLRRRGIFAVAAYAAVWAGAAAYLGIESGRLAALQKQAALLQPQVDAVIGRQMRWQALAPAVEPRRSGVELLFQTWQCLPSAETRITRFELTPNQIAVEGEAPNAQQAIAFCERLKARPELADYHFESGRPVLLPNEHAQFRIFGKQ